MSKSYVIADLHGRADLLELALRIIRERTAGRPNDHRVIFLGDYIDRGPQSAQVVHRIRKGQEAGLPWVALKGNHEDFMVGAMIEQDQMLTSGWLMNGGQETLDSYEGHAVNPVSDAAWMKGLPAFIEDEHRVYVHAFAPEDQALADAPEHVLLWSRYPKGADVGYRGKHVVHGHTPQKDGPELYASRTNLDCGAVFCGRLVIGVFDDSKAGGPVETIEVQA